MRKNLLGLVVILLLCSPFAFAQAESKPETEDLPPVNIIYPAIYSPILLPESPNSWTINIYKEGGIMGGSYLSIVLNSEGKFQCGEKGSQKSILFKDKTFLELSESVKNIENIFYSKDFAENSIYCNDCLHTALSFYRQIDKEKAKDKKPQPQTSKPDVKEIYRKVLEIVNCNKVSKKD